MKKGSGKPQGAPLPLPAHTIAKAKGAPCRRNRRGRVRRLDRASPACRRPSRDVGRHGGPRQCPRQLGRRIPHDPRHLRQGRASTRTWRSTAWPNGKGLAAIPACRFFTLAGRCFSSPPTIHFSTTASPCIARSACRPNCSICRLMTRRFPMIDFSGIQAGLFEPGFGALMARRAVQTLVQRFVADGGPLLAGSSRCATRRAVGSPRST